MFKAFTGPFPELIQKPHLPLSWLPRGCQDPQQLKLGTLGTFGQKVADPQKNRYLFWKEKRGTLQGINISHLGKRKIIFKSVFGRGYVSSLEGIALQIAWLFSSLYIHVFFPQCTWMVSGNGMFMHVSNTRFDATVYQPFN